MKKVSTILAVCALVFASTVLAQEESEERDFLEVSISGGVAIPSGGISDWHDSLGAKTGWLFGFEFGYFVKPEFVVGISFDYSQHKIDTDSPAESLHHRVYSPALYGKYYFMGESNFVPYVKGQVGIDFPKFTTIVTDMNIGGQERFRELSYDPSFAFGLGVGAFYYTSDYSGIFAEADYRMAKTSNTHGGFQGTDYPFEDNIGMISLRAGIHVFFSKGE